MLCLLFIQVEECVTVAATPATLTSCIRMSVIGACDLAVAAKMAAVASAATTVMKTAPLRPTGTEAETTGTATAQIQISTRATAMVGATTPAVEVSLAVVGAVRISLASHRASLARLPLLRLQGGCSL